MAYIEPGLFFVRVRPGQKFRFRIRPGAGTDVVEEGVTFTCTGLAARIEDDKDSLHVPFVHPDGREGAFWRSACHDLQFEIREDVR